MKSPDFVSTLFAGILGAGIVSALICWRTSQFSISGAVAGFGIGALVQVGVRLTGVS